MNPLELRLADFDDPQVRALVRTHLSGMRGASPPEAVFAFDLSALRAPELSVWTVWRDDRLAGIGALKQLTPTHGELKSMRTHVDFLRRGVGTFLLEHLIDLARRRGYTHLSLETGTGPTFEPALALYRRRGFLPGPPFGDYTASPFNQYLHLEL